MILTTTVVLQAKSFQSNWVFMNVQTLIQSCISKGEIIRQNFRGTQILREINFGESRSEREFLIFPHCVNFAVIQKGKYHCIHGKM